MDEHNEIHQKGLHQDGSHQYEVVVWEAGGASVRGQCRCVVDFRLPRPPATGVPAGLVTESVSAVRLLMSAAEDPPEVLAFSGGEGARPPAAIVRAAQEAVRRHRAERGPA